MKLNPDDFADKIREQKTGAYEARTFSKAQKELKWSDGISLGSRKFVNEAGPCNN